MKIQIRCDLYSLREKLLLGLSQSGHMCREVKKEGTFISDTKYYIEFEINEKDNIIISEGKCERIINKLTEKLKQYKENK
jgi:hypothetical protein